MSGLAYQHVLVDVLDHFDDEIGQDGGQHGQDH